MAVVLKCPACRGKFKYNVVKGWPDNCPLCKEDINNYRADDDIVMPAFLSLKSKATDKVARDIMDGSETRAQLAAGMAGVPVEDMNNLKITNLSDRRDSEISAMPVNNVITQQMAVMQARGMPTGFGAGADTTGIASGAVTVNGRVQQGVEPSAGVRSLMHLQKKMAPVALPPMPLEMSNPNYRRRV